MNGKLIYLLEDDQDLLQLVKMVLIKNGYQVSGFGTAGEFQSQMKNRLPDLCILDINLPDGNGLDISHSLVSQPLTSQVPVLLISANQYRHDKLQYSGAWYFINKPFNMTDLLNMVGKLA